MTALEATRLLVVAKAPVPGRVKTRLAVGVGDETAARLAAAALADTLTTAAASVGAARCVLALDGDLADPAVVDGAMLAALVDGWSVLPQVEGDLGVRLAAAHAACGPGPVVQIGMDTPQVTRSDLLQVARGLADADAVLGPASDGGWWALGVRDPSVAAAIAGVPMSRPTTGADTRDALGEAGWRVGTASTLSDVDTAADAAVVAALAPEGRFARCWRETAGVLR